MLYDIRVVTYYPISRVPSAVVCVPSASFLLTVCFTQSERRVFPVATLAPSSHSGPQQRRDRGVRDRGVRGAADTERGL